MKLISAVFILHLIALCFADTCQTDFSENTFFDWPSNTTISQSFSAVPENTWYISDLYRNDLVTIAGNFYIVPGYQSLTLSNAIYSTSFSSSSNNISIAGYVSLTSGSPYTFIWQRDSTTSPSINTSVWESTSFTSASSYISGVWSSSVGLAGRYCFQTAPSPSSSPSPSPVSPSTTPSQSPSATPSRTPSISQTPTPSPTPVPSSSTSPSISVSPSKSPSPLSSPSSSVTPTSTPTATPSTSLEPSATASATASASTTPSISTSPSSSPPPLEILETYTEIEMRIVGSLSNFSAYEFTIDLADILQIDSRLIEIKLLSEGSVIVNFYLHDSTDVDSAKVASDLQDMVKEDDPSLEEAGIEVLDLDVNNDNSAAVLQKDSGSGGLSPGGAAAVGVLVPLAVIGMAGAAFYVYRRRKKTQGSFAEKNAVEMRSVEVKKEVDVEKGAEKSASKSSSDSDTEPQSESESESGSSETSSDSDSSSSASTSSSSSN